jgi:hypothetical protein
MVDEPNDTKKLPSGVDTEEEPNKFAEYYPNAESYEAEGQNLELQIRALKKRISRELEDELLRLQYELNERELRIRQKEFELQQREADLNAREARISRLEQFESQQSPKERISEQLAEDDLESEFDIEDLGDKEEKSTIEGGTRPAKVGKDYIPNPEGKGGLPGSKLSNSIVIDRGVYQGRDKITLENGNSLVWNKENKLYEFEFIPGDDARINANQGLKFTYFAVEAAYLNEGYDRGLFQDMPHIYSQTLLRKQVWYEKTPRNRSSDGIGEQYQGRVPFNVLMDILNKAVNVRLFTGSGEYIENQDIRRAYKNYRIRYERGTFYKTANGDLYSVIEKGSQINESKGNPPTYRTDANLKSPTYGERVETSTEERSRWNRK